MTHPGSQGGPVPAPHTGEPAASEVTPAEPRTGGKAPGGMWWVAWRQHRAQLAISLLLLAMVTATLLIFRMLLVNRIQELTGGLGDACTQFVAVDSGCTDRVVGTIRSEYATGWGLLRLGMFVLPVILGAFVGAPLFAREFEQHTQVYVLTQSVGRTFWWATKVIVAGVPVVLAMVGVGLLMDWTAAPFIDFAVDPMNSPGFETRGIVPAAYTLLAVAIAVTAGIATRSTVIALAAAVIVGGLVVVGLAVVRPHLLEPVRVSGPIDSAGTFFLPDQDSLFLDSGYLDATGTPVDFDGGCPALDSATVALPDKEFDRLVVAVSARGGHHGAVHRLSAGRSPDGARTRGLRYHGRAGCATAGGRRPAAPAAGPVAGDQAAGPAHCRGAGSAELSLG